MALEQLRVRSVHKANTAAFARAAGLTRVTVMRVGDVKRATDYKPDLDTIILWLNACQWRESLSAFLGQFEPGGSVVKPIDVGDLKRQIQRALTLLE